MLSKLAIGLVVNSTKSIILVVYNTGLFLRPTKLNQIDKIKTEYISDAQMCIQNSWLAKTSHKLLNKQICNMI